MRTSRTITYASLLSIVGTACGGITILEADDRSGEPADASGSAASTHCEDDGAISGEAEADGGSTAEDTGPADADTDNACPGPSDPRWEAGTLPDGCGVLGDAGNCTPLITRALACAIAADPVLCATHRVCEGCGGGYCAINLTVGYDGGTCPASGPPVEVSCWAGGRRPSGLAAHAAHADDPTARFFTGCAWLEAASVVAFERLAIELRLFGAPEELARDCERAAIEEREHAETMNRISARYGAKEAMASVGARVERSLFDLARENVVEGCVKETFAAAVAVHQSMRATDSDLRHAMKKIAHEEASHADLSRRIDAWARTRLDEAARERLDAAAREAADTLARDVDDGRCDAELRQLAGLPSPAVSRRILRGLRSAVERDGEARALPRCNLVRERRDDHLLVSGA